MSNFDAINSATGYANGDTFANADQVRQYFTVASQIDMFGRDAVQDQDTLSEWAEIVIQNGWHMKTA